MTTETPGGQFAARPGYLLSRVGTAVQSGFKDVLAGWQLRPLHFMLLTGIQAGAGSSQQELCRALGIDSGNVVELLDRLEDLGYATRTRSAEDRRRQVVTMTAAGRAALAEIGRAVGAFEAGFFEPLSRKEQAELGRLLGRLYSATPEAHGKGYLAPEAASRQGPHGGAG
jgi:DNA-binding MarR family transcriptional regulator